MALSQSFFNEQIVGFANDVENSFHAIDHQAAWELRAELASPDSSRLRAVIRGFVDLRAPSSPDDTPLARLAVLYKLCADSSGQFVAVEHSSMTLKATVERAPIIRWDYDRDAHSKPTSHVQVAAHRGALTQVLSKLDHETPHLTESLHFPTGGDRFRPCLEDIIEFLIRDCGFAGAMDWRYVVHQGRTKWRRIQTRAVVRDCPSEAVSQLQAMGYAIAPPRDGERPERTDKLSGW